MISEFRSVLAMSKPEEMVQEFEGAVNRSLYYMAEGLKGYKGWTQTLILHSEKIPFGFLNLGYKDLVGVSANTQGVPVRSFEDLGSKTQYQRMNVYIAVIAPDVKTCFVYAATNMERLEIFQETLVALANRLDAPTLKTWALISAKEPLASFRNRGEQGDWDTPDLDDLPEVMRKLDSSENVAREVTRMIYALDMESQNLNKVWLSFHKLIDDLSPGTLSYLDDLMFSVIPTTNLYNNKVSYQTF